MTNYYLCCGNKTGVRTPGEWVGIDNDPSVKPDVLADIRTIRTLPKAARVFATPPCGSFTDLPWRPATNKDRDILEHCYSLCFSAQGLGAEWLLENNQWAQRFLGPADFHRGPHYFWGNMIVAEFKRSKAKQAMPGQNPLARAALPVIIP